MFSVILFAVYLTTIVGNHLCVLIHLCLRIGTLTKCGYSRLQTSYRPLARKGQLEFHVALGDLLRHLPMLPRHFTEHSFTFAYPHWPGGLVAYHRVHSHQPLQANTFTWENQTRNAIIICGTMLRKVTGIISHIHTCANHVYVPIWSVLRVHCQRCFTAMPYSMIRSGDLGAYPFHFEQ